MSVWNALDFPEKKNSNRRGDVSDDRDLFRTKEKHAKRV